MINPDVVIARIFENTNYLRNISSGVVSNHAWHHIVDFLVTPREGIYTASSLQTFMDNLLPKKILVDYKSNFYTDEGYLHFGMLRFHENFGQEKITRVCTLSDEELFNNFGFVDGQQIIEKSSYYIRDIYVRPFPCESYVKKIKSIGFFSAEQVKLEDLKKYQSSSFQK